MSDKTEAPTAQRLEKARRDGNVAVSSALVQAAGMLVAAALVPSAVRALVERASQMLREVLAASPEGQPVWAPEGMVRAVLEMSLPLLVAVGLTAAVVGGLQTGGLLAWNRISPDLGRLNPTSFVKGIFSSQRAFALLRALVSTLAVGWLAWRQVVGHAADLARCTGRIGEAAMVTGVICSRVFRDAVVVMLVLGVADVVVSRRSWLKGLRMSKAEVQREHKESEGDPQLKASRERAWHEMAASATIASVKEATVVVVNPTHLANAIRFDEEQDEAPVLLAKGEGEVARRMVEAARAYGIPVVRDVPVARALAELGEGEAIPRALYEAMALILQDVFEHPE